MWEACIVVLWASANSTARLSGSCSAGRIPQKEIRNKARTERRGAIRKAGFMVSSSRGVAGLGNTIVNERSRAGVVVKFGDVDLRLGEIASQRIVDDDGATVGEGFYGMADVGGHDRDDAWASDLGRAVDGYRELSFDYLIDFF